MEDWKEVDTEVMKGDGRGCCMCPYGTADRRKGSGSKTERYGSTEDIRPLKTRPSHVKKDEMRWYVRAVLYRNRCAEHAQYEGTSTF